MFSSKAVGEPPLFLAASAFFAAKEAVRAARSHNPAATVKSYFQFDAPATAERLRMACEDELTDKVPELPEEGTYLAWGVQV